jgi:hypothetical protein
VKGAAACGSALRAGRTYIAFPVRAKATLLGDGNSGRIAAIEQRVSLHEQSLQRAKGFAVASGGLFTLAQFTIELLRRK